MIINTEFVDSMENLDDSLDKAIALLGLQNEKCGFSHGPGVDLPSACDYICQYLGYSKNNTVTELIRIPVCKECINGLHSNEWVLLYCISCNNSQWVYKPISKLKFKDGVHLIWLDECPKCKEEEKYHGES